MITMPKPKNRNAVFKAIIAGLFNALFLTLSFPPFSYWGFAFLIPFPLLVLVRSTSLSPSRAAFWAGVGCLPGWIYNHFWVADVSQAGLIPLVLWLGFYTFLFVWIATHAYRRFGSEVIVLPLIWVAIEFFRGSILWGGYPWYLIAHPLIDSPLGILAMPASWGGVYLVSFLCATYSIILLVAISARSSEQRLRAGIIAGVLFSAWIGIGYLLIPSEPENPQTLRVGIIQPNVAQDNRTDWTVRQRVRDWYTLRDLTNAAASDPRNPELLDVIIWPEGFVPGWTFDPLSLNTEHNANLAWSMVPRREGDVPELINQPSKISATTIVDELLILQKALDIPMVVGSVAYDNLQIVDTDAGIEYQRDAMYNSAFVILDGQPQPVWYDKLHLTPFGEVMPYISTWQWLESKLLSVGANGMEFALSEGKEPRVLLIPYKRDDITTTASLATPICFEATISSVCRKLVFRNGKRQAAVLVNMTNDGWFGTSDAGRTSHMLAARWRCVELNTPMIRCANTGISCVIDHTGQIETRSIVQLKYADPQEGHLISDVTLAQGTTVFASIGDLFGWVCFVLSGLLVFRMIFRRSSSVQPADE